MDVLKKIFPLSFKAKDIVSLIIYIIVYLVIGTVGGVIIGFLAGIPILGIIFALVGSLISLYVFVGIVLEVLSFLNIIK
ncbi:MAG: hypothetical protein IKV54_03540 [Clostridia bacterium]|nr:hypothetical protein [Clostridia bacterium]